METREVIVKLKAICAECELAPCIKGEIDESTRRYQFFCCGDLSDEYLQSLICTNTECEAYDFCSNNKDGVCDHAFAEKTYKS